MGRRAISLAEALGDAQTGDLWLFRGHKLADRTIQLATNAPVNHVAMAVALDDLPPLLWHTEAGRSVVDVWTGERHRGAQLHRLDEAVEAWTGRYGQRAYLRQLDTTVTPAVEDELLRVIAEYDGRPFPPARSLAWKWLRGRWRQPAHTDVVYCAELLATTYRRMGLLDEHRPANWYDPGSFWSGHHLVLSDGAKLGAEIEVGGGAGPPA